MCLVSIEYSRLDLNNMSDADEDHEVGGSAASGDGEGDKMTGRFTSEESKLIETRLKEFMEAEEITAADLVPALRENEGAGRGSATGSTSRQKKYNIWKELASD